MWSRRSSWGHFVSLVAALGLALSSSTEASSSTFRVRKQQWTPGLDHRREQAFDLEFITFSNEGEPIDVPPFELQLFPTTPTLSDESELALETALEDFLRSELEKAFPVIEDDKKLAEFRNTGKEIPPQFTSAEVRILSLRTITGSLRQRRRTEGRNLQPGQQQTGQELEVETTLRFLDGTFPSGEEIDEAMEEALFDNFDKFLKDFLSAYETPELAAVRAGNYFSGFTAAPTAAPTRSPVAPTGGGSAPTGTSGSGNAVSEANQAETPVNSDEDGRIDALYPAIICGVGVFLITTLILAYRRKADANRLNESFDSYSGSSVRDLHEDEYDIDHVSIDYDGREEARQLEMERHMAQMALASSRSSSREEESSNDSSASSSSMPQQQQEQLQHYEEDNGDVSSMAPSLPSLPPPSRTRSSRLPRQNRDPPTIGALKSEKMGDGFTTIHVPPIIERSASRRYEATPMVVASASSADSAYYEEELGSLEGTSTDYSNNYYDDQRELPSMLGGSEFGMGSIINRGLI